MMASKSIAAKSMKVLINLKNLREVGKYGDKNRQFNRRYMNKDS